MLFVNPSTSPTPLYLHDLHLATAHALVWAQDSSAVGVPEIPEMPAPAEHPTDYVQQIIDGLCELCTKDPLTGLANRRYFHHTIERELERVARSGDAALLLILDIDHFKKINDTYGHPVGDMVLQSVAQTLDACVRPMDTVVRYGGEEFAVILPACQVAFAHIIAERLRRSVEATAVCVSPGVQIHLTISVGGAFALQWTRSTRQFWIDRADQQLYHAKQSGRNRVSIEEQTDSTVSAEEKSLLFAAAPSDFSPEDELDELPPLDPLGSVN